MKYFLILAVCFSTLAFAQTQPHWSYHFPKGPAKWGSLPEYSSCQFGVDQSPIDIESGKVAGLSKVAIDSSLEEIIPVWKTSKLHVLFNGHTVQGPYYAGSSLSFDV